MISLKIWERLPSWRTKCSLPFFVRGSKTPLEVKGAFHFGDHEWIGNLARYFAFHDPQNGEFAWEISIYLPLLCLNYCVVRLDKKLS